MQELKTSESQRKAVYKYDDKFERVNCRLAKGTKERIQALKYSANDFIKLAVAEKLEREEKIENTKPGKVISLFPDEVLIRPKANVVEASTAVASSSYKKAASGGYYHESGESRIHGSGNGERHRVPIFTEADRTIPAYIRRLEDN